MFRFSPEYEFVVFNAIFQDFFCLLRSRLLLIVQSPQLTFLIHGCPLIPLYILSLSCFLDPALMHTVGSCLSPLPFLWLLFDLFQIVFCFCECMSLFQLLGSQWA